jgi:hypothetical protein
VSDINKAVKMGQIVAWIKDLRSIRVGRQSVWVAVSFRPVSHRART